MCAPMFGQLTLRLNMDGRFYMFEFNIENEISLAMIVLFFEMPQRILSKRGTQFP